MPSNCDDQGPVAAITTVADDAEAVELANHTSYGLVSSVMSGDIARAQRVADQLRTGLGLESVPVCEASAAVAAHTGEGVVGVAVLRAAE